MLFGRLSACGLQRTASKIGISPKIRAITQFKPSKLNLYSVQKTHGVKWVITCPTKLGFPMRRRRTFTFGFSLEKWVWVGPATHDDVQEEFDSLFNKPYSFLVMFICWQTPIALKNLRVRKQPKGASVCRLISLVCRCQSTCNAFFHLEPCSG